jgi:hypothetical protein
MNPSVRYVVAGFVRAGIGLAGEGMAFLWLLRLPWFGRPCLIAPSDRLARVGRELPRGADVHRRHGRLVRPSSFSRPRATALHALVALAGYAAQLRELLTGEASNTLPGGTERVLWWLDRVGPGAELLGDRR